MTRVRRRIPREQITEGPSELQLAARAYNHRAIREVLALHAAGDAAPAVRQGIERRRVMDEYDAAIREARS